MRPALRTTTVRQLTKRNNFILILRWSCESKIWLDCTLRVDVGSILIIDHVVQIGNFARLVGNDGETQVSAGDFIDILNPFLMRIESICTQPNKFDTSFLELWFEFSKCHRAGRQYRIEGGQYLCGANGGKVFRMREQNSPTFSDEIVNSDVSLSGVCFEIWGNTSQPLISFVQIPSTALPHF